jgi:hypothetical protein
VGCEEKRSPLLNFWKNELPMSGHKTFVSAHKDYYISIIYTYDYLDIKCQQIRRKDSDCFLNFWKNEILMSGQKTFVSAHKEYFWLYDRSENIYEPS